MENCKGRVASRSRAETAPEQGLHTAMAQQQPQPLCCQAPTQSLVSWGSQHGCPSTRPPDDDSVQPTCSPWLKGHRSLIPDSQQEPFLLFT